MDGGMSFVQPQEDDYRSVCWAPVSTTKAVGPSTTLMRPVRREAGDEYRFVEDKAQERYE